jgi:hypothetical protein
MPRPSRLPIRVGIVAATVTTVAALAVVLAPDSDAPDYPHLYDVTSAPVVTPGKRPTLTDRGGKRETLAPLPGSSTLPGHQSLTPSK